MNREFYHRVSFVLNLGLLMAVVVLLLRESSPAPGPGLESTPNETPALNQEPKLPQHSPLAMRATQLASDRPRWIEQLRAAGVSKNVLARVVRAEFDEQWSRRVEECNGDPEKIAALQQLKEREEEAQMRAALGEETFKLWDQENILGEANVGKIQLTASEADTIYRLKKKLQQRQWEVEDARVRGEIDDAESSDAYEKAYSDFTRQFKALLGEERYAKSQGLDSGTAAANLRQEFAKANPSDSQFEELLKAQQQWNERRSALDRQFQDEPTSAAYAEQIKALDAVRDQEYQRVLGTNVFDSLQKEQDDRYARMKRYENNWGLDDGKIDYVYGTVKYYEKSVQDYQAQARALEDQGHLVDWAAVNTNLKQYAQQTEQALQNYLGQDSFNKMQRNGVFQFEQLRRGAFR